MKQILAKLRLAPEELRIVLSYERRRYKAVVVDSSAEPARTMMLHNPPPGRYVGLGDRIVRSDDPIHC